MLPSSPIPWEPLKPPVWLDSVVWDQGEEASRVLVHLAGGVLSFAAALDPAAFPVPLVPSMILQNAPPWPQAGDGEGP